MAKGEEMHFQELHKKYQAHDSIEERAKLVVSTAASMVVDQYGLTYDVDRMISTAYGELCSQGSVSKYADAFLCSADGLTYSPSDLLDTVESHANGLMLNLENETEFAHLLVVRLLIEVTEQMSRLSHAGASSPGITKAILRAAAACA